MTTCRCTCSRTAASSSPEYRALNADALVPTLVDGDHALTQSLAIVEYLDELHPQPPLLPGDALERAYVRALALEIACDIHPLNNLRVLKYLKHTLGVSEEAKDGWYRHWIEQGFAALEIALARSGRVGRFCLGDTPTLADVCLAPQVFNAQRFNVDLGAVPDRRTDPRGAWRCRRSRTPRPRPSPTRSRRSGRSRWGDRQVRH